MRAFAIVLAIAVAAGYVTRALFEVRASWGAPLAVLAAGGALVAIGVVLRNVRPAARRSRRSLPRDPGFPRVPLGAPYRGP